MMSETLIEQIALLIDHNAVRRHLDRLSGKEKRGPERWIDADKLRYGVATRKAERIWAFLHKEDKSP